MIILYVNRTTALSPLKQKTVYFCVLQTEVGSWCRGSHAEPETARLLVTGSIPWQVEKFVSSSESVLMCTQVYSMPIYPVPTLIRADNYG